MAILGFTMHASIPSVLVFLPIYIFEDLQLSYQFVGYALFILGVTHMFQFYFGKKADSNPAKYVIMGTLLSGIFLALLMFADTYIVLLLFLLFKGLGNSIWNVSAWTLMSKI